MVNILDLFKVIDAFGYEIGFRYKGERRYRSSGGGIITFIAIGLVIYLFSYFSQDCLNKTNPTTRMLNSYNNTITLNASSFFYGLYFTDGKNEMIENPGKYILYHALVTDWDKEKITYTLKFSKCNKTRHFSKSGLPEQMIDEKIPFFHDSYCLDLPEDFKLKNGGTEIPRISLQIFVMECMNKTMFDVDCKPYNLNVLYVQFNHILLIFS